MSAYVTATFASARRYLSQARRATEHGRLVRRDELIAQAMRVRARAKALRAQEAAMRDESTDLADVLHMLSVVQRDIDRAWARMPRGASDTETAEESPFFWLGSAGQGVKLAIDRLMKGAKR